MYCLYNFKTRGIGVISNINADTLIGNYISKNEIISSQSRLIWDGWIETNPLGRYINHNSNSNLYCVKKNNIIQVYSKYEIDKDTELTVNYMEIIKLINLPYELAVSYKIIDFDYIEEKIVINKSII